MVYYSSPPTYTIIVFPKNITYLARNSPIQNSVAAFKTTPTATTSLKVAAP